MNYIRNKKIFLLGLFLSLFFGGLILTATIVLAQPVDLGLSQVSSTLGLPSTDIRTIVANIIRVFLGLLGIIALVLMIYAGFEWMTSGGSEEKIAQAKKILSNATIGLIIILSAYSIVSFVISRLLSATTGYPEHCFDGITNEGETSKDCGGECASCGPGVCVDEPCGITNVFYIQSLPSGNTCGIRNVKLAVVFSEAVNISTLNPNTITVKKVSDRSIVNGSWVAGNNRNVALFVPDGGCSPVDSGNDCFASSTAYILEFNKTNAQDRDNGIKNYSSSRVLNCVHSGADKCTSVEFTTGDVVDRTSPTVTLDIPEPWVAGGVIPAKIHFTDDNGIQNTALYASSYFIGSQTMTTCEKSGTTTIDWSTNAGMVGNYDLKGVGLDWAGNSSENIKTVTLRPQHCYNHVKDVADGETDIDCGVGSGCGACANDKCSSDSDCASSYCEIPPGVCVDRMKISDVTPLSGAAGTFITIAGQYFGTSTGKVYFPKVSNPNISTLNLNGEWQQVSLANCGPARTWTPWQIIVMAPSSSIVSSPILVETVSTTGKDGVERKFFDTTNNDWGRKIDNFTLTTQLKPGLCPIGPPDNGNPNDVVTLLGKNFFEAGGQAFFGSAQSAVQSWHDGEIRSKVPYLDRGPTGVYVSRLADRVESNSVYYFINGTAGENDPIISGVSPTSGAKGEYITIAGSKFGKTSGLVYFRKDGAAPGTPGDSTFPAQCNGATWSDNQIIIKFPSAGTLANGNYNVVVQTNDNRISNAAGPIFVLGSGVPAPGICKIDPIAGPVPFAAGGKMSVYGEYFSYDGGVAPDSVGLLSLWDFNDGSRSDVFGHVSYDCVTCASITTTAKYGSNALFQNTSNDQIFPVSSPSNSTLEFWFKPVGSVTSRTLSTLLFYAKNDSTNFWLYLYREASGAMTLKRGTSLINLPISSGWNHFVFVYSDANKTIESFLNNTRVDSYNLVSEGSLRLWKAELKNSDFIVDDLAVYDRPLTLDEIEKHYNDGIILNSGGNISSTVYFWRAGASTSTRDGRVTTTEMLSSATGFLELRPPTNTQTGPVAAYRAGDNKLGNGVAFTVNDCVINKGCTQEGYQCCPSGSDKGICIPASEYCAGTTRTTGYMWRFSTRDIPAPLTVVERCDDNTESGRALPSPSPSTIWNQLGYPNYHSTVCRGALIEIEFSRPDVNVVSSTDFSIHECSADSVDLDRRFCNPTGEIVNVIDQGGHTTNFVPDISTKSGANSGRDYLELMPTSSYNNNTGKWKDNTWYRVALKAGINAGTGTSTVNLTNSRPCDFDGNTATKDDAAYCFLFKTGAENCTLRALTITPYSYWTNFLEAPLRDHMPGGDSYDLYYAGHGLSNQRCIMMDMRGFAWQWSSSNISYADIYSGGNTIKNVQVSSIQNTVGVNLTNPNNAVNINAFVSTGTGVNYRSFSASSSLTIDLSEPKVLEYWPNCLETCTDADIGARFNVTMSDRNLNNLLESGPARLYKCQDENCSSTVLIDLRSLQLNPAKAYSELIISPSTSDGNRLEKETIYKVVLSRQSYTPTTSVGNLWSAARYNNPTSFNKPLNEEFAWRFRTKKEACKIDRVEVSPQVFTASNLTAKAIYYAQPYSASDKCSAKGQKLNALNANWTWYSASTSVATTTSFISQGYNPFCTAKCIRKGSDVPAGAVDRTLRVCGNGRVEAGEDCDPPNGNTGCSLNCLRMGNNDILSVGGNGTDLGKCGDGVVSSTKGEECDPKSEIPDQRINCTSNCLHTGSKPSTGAKDLSASICGNNYVGFGEDCDLGIAPSSTVVTSSMGCSANCLHQGTRLSNAWCSSSTVLANNAGFDAASFRAFCDKSYSQCGDGMDSPDEDPGCDIGNGLNAANCNEYCLLKIGDSSFDTTTPNNCPATGAVENGCDPVTRQHVGSSLLYSTPSICGDHVTGLGEDKSCEDNLVINNTSGFFNPWVLAKGVGLGAASGDPRTQQTDIVAQTQTNTSGNAIKSGSGKFVIKCGFQNDGECVRMGGFTSQYGVDNDSCCHIRPQLIGVYPGVTTTNGSTYISPTGATPVVSGAIDACPNTYLSAHFDQMIDQRTLPGNFIIARGIVGGASCSNSEDITSRVAALINGQNHWYQSLWQKMVRVFKSLVGSTVQASPTGKNIVTWCAGQDVGVADIVPDTYGSGSKIKVDLKKPLATSTDYIIILDPEIKDIRGIRLGSIAGKNIFWRFSTGPEVCKVDKVAVTPSQYYFSISGSTTTLEAIATNENNKQIQPIPGFYAWDIIWGPYNNNFVSLTNTTSVFNVITAQNRNGEIDLRATASITDNQYPSLPNGLVATGRSHMIVFLCENPWPPKDLVIDSVHNIIFPYEDKVGNNDDYSIASDTFTGLPTAPSPGIGAGYFNFATYYCADNGNIGITDDLPYLRPTVQVTTSLVSETSTFKRFLFTNARNADAIGVQIFPNPKHLSARQWFLNSKDFGGQGFKGNLQNLKVSGYDAVSDGNNIYVDALDVSTSTGTNIFTNIYLFSINSDAKPETKNVFDQIIKYMRFNTNLTNYGYCGVSINSPGSSTTCATDFDCTNGEICSVQIDKLKRNYQRIQDLGEIGKTLNGYNLKNNAYPELKEGTYLSGQTLSVWPSWSVLGNAVGTSFPSDPVNKIGLAGSCSSSTGQYCLNDAGCAAPETCVLHDSATGWSTADRRFSFACNSSSLAYRYIFSTSTGYKVYSMMEDTGLTISNINDFLNVFITSTIHSHFSIFDNANRKGNVCMPGETITTMQSGRCGDGKLNLNLNEQCDPPGFRVYEPGCVSNNTIKNLKICNNDCSGWTNSTTPCTTFSKCGNNIIEAGETCDDGASNGAYNHCDAPNQNPAYPLGCRSWGYAGSCGDGALQSKYEFCDTVNEGTVDKCKFAVSGMVTGLPKEPLLYFLVDLSGSMGSNFAGTTKKKLNYIKEQMPLIADRLQNKAKIGVATFEGSSDTDECANGIRIIDRLSPTFSFTSTSIGNMVSTWQQGCFTPTGEAIQWAKNVIDSEDNNRPKSLILVTDGDFDGDVNPDVVIRELNGAGVLTYVLAVDEQNNNFQTWAESGGTLSYIRITNGTSLADEITNIYNSFNCRTYSANKNQSCKYDCSGFGGFCGDGILDSNNGEQCEVDQSCSVGGVSGKRVCSSCIKRDGLSVAKWLFDNVYTVGVKSRFSPESGNLSAYCDFGHCPTVITAGKFGSALYFSGSNDIRAYVPANTAFNSPTFTISVWVKPEEDNRTFARILAKGGYGVKDGNDYGSGFEVYYNPAIGGVGNKKIRFATWHGNYHEMIESASVVSTSVWTHVLVTRSDSGAANLYINGNLESSTTSAQMTVSTTLGLTIGNLDSKQNNYFKGAIDDLAFYDRVLTADEVRDLYDTNWLCVASTTPSRTTVNTKAICGDGKIDELNDMGIKEACDNRTQNGVECQNGYDKSCSYCSADCSNVIFRQATGYCGDGIVNTSSPEVCDVDTADNKMYAASTSAGVVSTTKNVTHNGYEVALCTNEANTKLNASSTAWSTAGLVGNLLTKKKGAKICSDNCKILQNNCIECGLSPSGVKVGGYIMNVLEPDSNNPLYHISAAANQGTVDLYYDSRSDVDLFNFSTPAEKNKYRVGYNYAASANFNKYNLYPAPFESSGDFATINSNPVCSLTNDLGVERYQLVLNDDRAVPHRRDFPIVSDPTPGQYDLILSPTMASNTAHIRIVVSWSGVQELVGGFYAPFATDPMWEGARIGSTTGRYYYNHTGAGYTLHGIWWHRAASTPSLTNAEAFTVDLNAIDATHPTYAFYVRSPNVPMKNFVGAGNVKVEVYFNNNTGSGDYSRRFDVVYPNMVFYLDAAKSSDNADASYWHVFNIKRDEAAVANISDIETTFSKDGQNVPISRLRTSELYFSY